MSRLRGAILEHAGDGPFFSPFLEAFAVPTDDGTMLRLAARTDRSGLWLTGEEAERAAKEAAESRVRELEALVAAARSCDP